jgi:hypothetical protein
MPILQSAPQRLDEPLKSLAALGLSSTLHLARHRRRDRQPEPYEQRQRLGGDSEIAFQTLDLTLKAIETPHEGRFAPVRPIWRQKGRNRRFHNGRSGQLLALGQVGDLPEQLGWEIHIHPVAHHAPHKLIPSS